MKNFYEKELLALKKANRLRKRKLFDDSLIDMASNDYLGLATNKKLLQRSYKLLKKQKYLSSKASLLVNGYSKVHQKFEKKLCKLNDFAAGIVVGSGFLANLSLIESLVRTKDVLFIDEQYHASGMLATKLVQGEVVVFKHNDTVDLQHKIERLPFRPNRIIIAIEGIYSMGGDIAPMQFDAIASQYEALLLVDEAHSSGVIGKNLLGWFDFYNIKPQSNHIKMGTLGKAYGSYGAYILASEEIISFLENRAKPIIYSTAPSLFDITSALINLKYLQKHKKKICKKIQRNKKMMKTFLGLETDSLILPIEIGNNAQVIQIQNDLIQKGYLVGAIRQPTVKKAILRVILKLDIEKKQLLHFVHSLNTIL